MSVCPKCNQRLIRTKSDRGFFFRCPACDGRAVGLSVLRRAIPPDFVRGLWVKARRGEGTRGQRCPICRRATIEIPVPVDGQDVPLDICVGCQFVWFDPHEFEHFPTQPRQEEPSDRDRLPEKVREAMAMADLKLDEARRCGGDFGGQEPEETWKYIPALFGLPVEHDVHPIRCWPWITWTLAAVMVLTFALSFANLREVVEQYGLVPAQMWRHGGLTLPSSFFLHAGLLHLIGNAYFLLVFGDNVEDQVGRWRYVLLVAAAALAGDLLHVAADPRSMIPCIGASGGISGVIVFYALKFPRARLGFMVRYWMVFRWFHVPAWSALIAWFLWQLFLAYHQLAGAGHVSALAHLGGAGAGLVGWLFWRENCDTRHEESFSALRRDPRSRL